MHAKFAIAAVAAGLCSFAHGSITGTLGQVTQIAQPADAQLNVITSSAHAFCWNEAQDFTLVHGLQVDASAIGNYAAAGDLVFSTLSPGTIVRSHYIHFDVVPGTTGAIQGTVGFDSAIIGVIVLNTPSFRHLDDSDYLGHPTLFTHGADARGMEMGPDSFRILAVGNAIQFSMTISEPGDFIRVITQGNVPAPGTMGVAGLAVLGVLRRRR